LLGCHGLKLAKGGCNNFLLGVAVLLIKYCCVANISFV
jgi:hypothetical protein